MSIIEKIKETEALAASIKSDAEKEVKEKLELSRKKNNIYVETMMNELKISLQKLNNELNSELDKLEKEKYAECEKINQNEEEKAKAKQNEAIEFILKKVIDS